MPRFPITMPQLGESIAEATIREVLVAPGETVKADQNLFEVETDKAMMEVTTPCGGVIAEITALVGTSYPVGSQIAIIEASEEDATKAGLIRPVETPRTGSGTHSGNENLHFAIAEKDLIDHSARPR